MKLNSIVFCHDTRYFCDNDKKTYAVGAFPYSLWQERFLPHCEHFYVIGRKSKHEQITASTPSSGENVTHILLDNINTPRTFLIKRKAARKAISDRVTRADILVIRGPAEFGMIAAKAARKAKKPYVVEMSGCAFDHTWHHGSIIGKLYAPIKYLRARQMVWHADQTLYVTQNFLQKRYPTKGLTATASNVDLHATPTAILQARLRKITAPPASPQIALIGNHGNKLKGIDIAIKALAHLHKSGQDFHFHILGEGNPTRWQRLINKHKIADKITFHQPLAGREAVLHWLDSMNIYIQPSRHEGLPRALIEAMSRGLPALASNAGGTAELLPPDCIHQTGNHKQLANQLSVLINDKEMQNRYAAQNFTTAQLYNKENLAPIRQSFYENLKRKI